MDYPRHLDHARINPDGHHLVEAGGGGNDPYLTARTATTSKAAGAPALPGNSHFGTDINRNFPFLWGCCNGSSGTVCNETYRGPTARSDPEDNGDHQPVRTLVARPARSQQHRPGADHRHRRLPEHALERGGQPVPVGLDPHACRTTLRCATSPPHARGEPRRERLPLWLDHRQVYSVDGDSVDWGYGELGMAAYTTEWAATTSSPPIVHRPPGWGATQGLSPANRGTLVYLARIARKPYLTSHGPDANTVTTNPDQCPKERLRN